MQLILTKNLCVGDLIRKIALGHERTILMTTNEKKLIGVVTQGDILRAIWNGAELQSTAEICINYNPLTLNEGDHPDAAVRMFAETGALVIPVVDKNRHVIREINVRDLVK
jgi:CBS-domain-containing membrane protein